MGHISRSCSHRPPHSAEHPLTTILLLGLFFLLPWQQNGTSGNTGCLFYSYCVYFCDILRCLLQLHQYLLSYVQHNSSARSLEQLCSSIQCWWLLLVTCNQSDSAVGGTLSEPTERWLQTERQLLQSQSSAFFNKFHQQSLSFCLGRLYHNTVHERTAIRCIVIQASKRGYLTLKP